MTGRAWRRLDLAIGAGVTAIVGAWALYSAGRAQGASQHLRRTQKIGQAGGRSVDGVTLGASETDKEAEVLCDAPRGSIAAPKTPGSPLPWATGRHGSVAVYDHGAVVPYSLRIDGLKTSAEDEASTIRPWPAPGTREVDGAYELEQPLTTRPVLDSSGASVEYGDGQTRYAFYLVKRVRQVEQGGLFDTDLVRRRTISWLVVVWDPARCAFTTWAIDRS